jgi:hypothetical protein
MSIYRQQIAKMAPDYDPRHIEAMMRLEHPTLDGLAPFRFVEEVGIAVRCVDEAGEATAEMIAQSFGL